MPSNGFVRPPDLPTVTPTLLLLVLLGVVPYGEYSASDRRTVGAQRLVLKQSKVRLGARHTKTITQGVKFILRKKIYNIKK